MMFARNGRTDLDQLRERINLQNGMIAALKADNTKLAAQVEKLRDDLRAAQPAGASIVTTSGRLRHIDALMAAHAQRLRDLQTLRRYEDELARHEGRRT